MSDSTQTTRFRFWLWLIALVGVIVPRRLRADWRQEWEGELRYREAMLADWDRLDLRHRFDLLWRSTSAFWDALWLQPQRWEDEMFQDLRCGLRLLWKNPGFALVAVFTLALGICGVTTQFSIVDAALLSGLLPALAGSRANLTEALKESARGHTSRLVRRFTGGLVVTQIALTCALLISSLLLIKSVSNQFALNFGFDLDSVLAGRMNFEAEYRTDDQRRAAFRRILTHLRSSPQFTHAAFTSRRNMMTNETFHGQIEGRTYERPEDRLESWLEFVSDGYFATLGLRPIDGREFEPGDTGDRRFVALVNESFARKHFPGESPLGHRLRANERDTWRMIIGVVPDTLMQGPLEQQRDGSGIFFPTEALPLSYLTLVVRGHESAGRLTQALQRELANVEPNLAIYGLNTPKNHFKAALAQGRSVASLFAIFGVASVLLAVVGLYGVMSFAVSRRTQEFGVRMALGAERRDIMRMVIAEGGRQLALGAALGIGLALAFVQVGGAALPTFLYRVNPRDPLVYGGVVLLLAVATVIACLFPARRAVSVLTGLVFGLAPALHATRFDLAPMLKATPGAALPARSRLSKALVITQVAMSLELLVGAGLFVRTLRNLNQIDAGFDRENLLIFSVNPRLEASRRASLYQQLTERIAAVPGVLAVGSSRVPLLGFSYTGESITVPGYTPSADEDMNVRTAEVSPNFLATMGIPLLLGREFTAQDNQQAPNAAVVSQSLTARFFPNQNPLGQRLIMDGIEMQIIGVARDAKYGGIREDMVPVVYLPYLQNQPTALAELSFAVRTVVDPVASVAAIREAVQSIDRNLPMFNVRSQSELIALSFTRERLFATLSSFFGLLALALVSIGLYGVMSYTVTRRTHEIGIRMALGAQSGSVLRMVMGESLGLVLVGSTIGLVAALAATRLVAGMLFGLTPTDPLTIALATLLLLAVATVSAWLPARRAARVDPLLALRHE